MANLNAKKKRSLFYQQPSKQNNTAEQSDKSQQLFIYENHSYKASFHIGDICPPKNIIKIILKTANKENFRIQFNTKILYHTQIYI